MLNGSATSLSPSLNINEASKACGLSPSVLRIWELRYGWPNPKRKPNGYRAYNLHQVQELKRVATLVKAGTPISSIIIDGLPRWPADQARATPPRSLVRTRRIAPPSGSAEAVMQRELIDALETRKGPHAKELLQRIFWSVRPADEPLTALVPALVAIAELRRAERRFPEEAEVVAMVKDRCIQLLRMLKSQEQPLLVVPARDGDQALAALVALILCYRGTPAKPWLDMDEPSVPYLSVSDLDLQPGNPSRLVGRLSTLGAEGVPSLADLLTGAGEILWAKREVQA